jgi:hypothetical protein
MAAQPLTEKYAENLDGVLGCFDRIVIMGSLAELCYAKGMTHYLYAHDIRIFDYARFAEPLRDEIRSNASGWPRLRTWRSSTFGRKTSARKTASRPS